MVLVVDPAATERVGAVLRREGETVIPLGRITARRVAAVVYRGELALDG
jgi:phosphoribosylaminoimidazole (AIR) synthetase